MKITKFSLNCLTAACAMITEHGNTASSWKTTVNATHSKAKMLSTFMEIVAMKGLKRLNFPHYLLKTQLLTLLKIIEDFINNMKKC